MDETLALAEVDNAVVQKKPIVFFCYTPHHMFALHELVILKEPKHDSAKWKVIQSADESRNQRRDYGLSAWAGASTRGPVPWRSPR